MSDSSEPEGHPELFISSDGDTLGRTPPVPVRKQLRQEVGFGCPINGCSNPLLEYHHFEPPWHVEKHHRPEGMIAMCARHHGQADAFTVEQLRQIKREAQQQGPKSVGERFLWLRRDLIAVVGGNFYIGAETVLSVHGKRIIWFNRDTQGHMLLNVTMLSTSRDERLWIEDNDWMLLGKPTDCEVPPGGRSLAVKYPNGDRLVVEFFTVENAVEVAKRYDDPLAAIMLPAAVRFPATFCEVQLLVGGTRIKLGPKRMDVPGFRVWGQVIVGPAGFDYVGPY